MPLGALSDLRVVECGGPVAAPYAGKLLADLGADVIKIEPPGGDPARARGPYPPGLEGNPETSGLFIYLNANKRSAIIDPELPRDRDRLQSLLATADVFIHDLPRAQAEARGIDPDKLRRRHPRLVHTWITPFGLSGPYADYEGDALTSVVAGGWAHITPGQSTRPDRPPVKVFGRQGDFQVALNAAVATLGALAGRDRSGAGDFVEVSAMEAIAGILEMAFVQWTYAGRIPSRLGVRTAAPMHVMEAKGGPIFVMAPDENQWQNLVHMMGDPEWAQLEVFADRLLRGENFDALRGLMEEWFANYTPSELFEMAANWRLPFAPVNAIGDLLASPPLEELGFWVTQDHPSAGPVTMPGAPYLMGEGGWELRRHAPLLGEHTDEVFTELSSGVRIPGGQTASGIGSGAANPSPSSRGGGRFAGGECGALGWGDEQLTAQSPIEDDQVPGAVRGASSSIDPTPLSPTPRVRPFDGLRVVDVTWAWSGPHCTLQFAALGADVIRVESYYRPCQNRRIPPYPDDIPGLNRSGSFNQNNQGKRSVVIDLHQPDGQALAHDLIRSADILVENYAVGVAAKLGLGWETLSQINPRLIMCSLSGWGQTGPFRERVAYGATLTMYSGLADLTGFPDRAGEAGISYGDPVGGLHAAVALMAGLRLREKTGRGQYIDLSQLETLAAVMAEGILPWTMHGEKLPRTANRDLQMAPHGVFPALGEDRWVSIVVRDDAEWRRFAALVAPALAADPRFATAEARKTNEDELEIIVSAWTAARDRWEVTRLLQAQQIAAFPSLDASDVAQDPHLEARHSYVELPHPEVGIRRHMGPPWRYAETPYGVQKAAPCMGESNEAVVMDLLGRSPDEYERLVAAKVVERRGA